LTRFAEFKDTDERHHPKRLTRLEAPLVTFSLNGREVTGRATETLLQVAQREGVDIPHLCYKEGMEAVGNCRACMVEIDGERVLAPSCCRAPTAGMKVATDSERAVASQKLVLELLLSDMPERSTPGTTRWTSGPCEWTWASPASSHASSRCPTCRRLR
jgi:predicted molibdopterin-dependent oxidoreductase YjgC